MESCQCVSPITGRLMTWLWRGKYCIGARQKDQRDESTLWLFSINIPVYLQRLDGWCKQSKPQLKFMGGRKSRHLVWQLTWEKKLSSSTIAPDISEGFWGPDKTKATEQNGCVALHRLTFSVMTSTLAHTTRTKTNNQLTANMWVRSVLAWEEITCE